MGVYLFGYIDYCFNFVIMDGKKLVNPLLDYFMEQELGSCEDLGKLYEIALPILYNTEGVGIICGTGGNYITGMDPYISDIDKSDWCIFTYKVSNGNIIEYFKSNKDGE